MKTNITPETTAARLEKRILRLSYERDEAADELGNLQDNCVAARGTSAEKRLKQAALIVEAEAVLAASQARLDGFKEASDIVQGLRP